MSAAPSTSASLTGKSAMRVDTHPPSLTRRLAACRVPGALRPFSRPRCGTAQHWPQRLTDLVKEELILRCGKPKSFQTSPPLFGSFRGARLAVPVLSLFASSL